MEDSRATAYHEAGHAVAAFILGHDLGPVILEEREISLGVTATPPPNWVIDNEGYLNTDRPEIRKYLADTVVIGFAGWWAVKLGTGIEDNKGAQHDFDEATRYVQYLASWDGELQEYWDECDARCEMLMQENWAAVEAVAEELLRKGSLSAEEVGSLVRGTQ